MFYLKVINQICSLFLVICSFAICAQSDVPRPRGVSLSKAPQYAPAKDFTCFDGTVTIPFNYVNDDYCDCFDGSDEPGTSACLNGVFHCTNAGHRPQNLPSSRINDGICDCCDGTDEYATSNKCSNTCVNLGREARAEAQRLVELHKAGSQLRAELIQNGHKQRSELAEQLAQLEKDKDEAEQIKAEKEILKTEIESKENEALRFYREAEEKERLIKAAEEQKENNKEATDTFHRFDEDGDGLLNFNELQVFNVFDKDKDGSVSEEEAKYFLGDNLSVDIEGFTTNTWPLLKPLIMMDQGMFRPEESHQDVEDIDEADSDNRDTLEDVDNVDANEDDENINEELPLEDKEEPETENKSTYDEETQKLVDDASEARRQFSEAERAVREIESNIGSIKAKLDKDYGPQYEFATLDEQCFEYEDKEYVYKLCVFQKATQKAKNGGLEIGLGNWGEWSGGVDDEYKVMKYTDGVVCWNGPNRSTTVYIQCGLESKILSVSEPFRCEYKMEFSTPAVCDNTKMPEHLSHDEL